MDELNRGFEAGAFQTPAFESAPFERGIESYNKVATQKGVVKQIMIL